MKKSYFIRLFIILLLCLLLALTAIAHPGRLDSSGGHYVRTPGHGYPVGSYHYHDGPPASGSSSNSREKSLEEVFQNPVDPIPKVNMSFIDFPDKIYVGQASDINVSVPHMYIDDIVLSLSSSYYAELADDVITGTAPGTVTVTAYLNELSVITRDVEVFPLPREVITLTPSRDFAFVGIPFEVYSDAYFLTKKDAPKWNADNVVTYSADNANIKISKDFEGIYVTFDGKANFKETIKVKGEHGGYNEISVKVYNINQSLIIIFSVLLTFLLVFLIIVFIKKHYE